MSYNQGLKAEVENLTKLLMQSNELINSFHEHREIHANASINKSIERNAETKSNTNSNKCLTKNSHTVVKGKLNS